MSVFRKMSIAAVMVGTLAFAVQPVLAAPVLCYYSFSNWNGVNDIETNTFSVTNSSQVVTIDGWQVCNTTGCTADVYYYLYKQDTFFDTKVGTVQVTGNYPQSGAWYNKNFTNVATGSGYYINIGTSNYDVSGAGNAYDGY